MADTTFHISARYDRRPFEIVESEDTLPDALATARSYYDKGCDVMITDNDGNHVDAFQ